MTRTGKTLTVAFAIALAASQQATARPRLSSDLLLPWFEVDLLPSGVTTLFAVGNAADRPVDVLAAVHTNWGVRVLEVPFTLQPGEVRTVNLRDWLAGGEPLAAAASGRPSPESGLYHSSEVRPGTAVGYVTLRTGASRPDALWGDWFLVDDEGNRASGDTLADIDRSSDSRDLCRRHLVRYLNGGGFDGGTEVILWRDTEGQPSSQPDGGLRQPALAASSAESGRPSEVRELALLPLERVTVADLGLAEAFGTLLIETEAETWIGLRHSAEGRFSAGFQAYCLESESAHLSACREEAALAVDVLLNGQPAGAPRGPLVETGSQLDWTFVLTNPGETGLGEVRLEGIAAACPRAGLPAGESMECTATGTALSGQRSLTVVAVGRGSCSMLSSTATGHYEAVTEDVYTEHGHTD